jgi:hypothetical protein
MRARCSCSSSQQGLVIGFGAINAGELPAAVRLLSDCSARSREPVRRRVRLPLRFGPLRRAVPPPLRRECVASAVAE